MTSSSPRISLLLLQVIFVTFLSMTSSTYLPETGGFSRDDFVEAKRSEGVRLFNALFLSNSLEFNVV
ncbi:hypothetical protein AALP_AA2G164500 [Arabis alpina]|uniref:Uncharacterized protein n=1 Tax=Arabis alpina TaxID=50452 RepID=A0A087HHW9_ARAAL|nr:hypothetical protein AALP_AA2G164500 [Arabis alpina]